MIVQTGVIKLWKNDKGFGFIQQDDGGDDVFVHFKAFGNIARRPKSGDRVSYQVITDKDGRLRAGDVTIEGLKRRSPNTQSSNRRTNHQKKTSTSTVTKLIYAAVAVFAIMGVISRSQIIPAITGFTQPENNAANVAVNTAAQQAFQNHDSGLQLQADGTVTRLLADDNDGSRHQKFIIRISPNQTLLISHNIDLAPKLTGLKTGDTVSVYGEYEWNDRGGLIHWTHHDPNGKHIGGWIQWKGKRYE